MIQYIHTLHTWLFSGLLHGSFSQPGGRVYPSPAEGAQDMLPEFSRKVRTEIFKAATRPHCLS